MAMVAGGQLGLVEDRAQSQSESESLEKLRKDTSQRQAEASGRIYWCGQEQGGPFLRFIRPTPTNHPNPGCLTWGEEGGGQRRQLPVAGSRSLGGCGDAAGCRGGGAGGQKRGGRVPWEAGEGKDVRPRLEGGALG